MQKKKKKKKKKKLYRETCKSKSTENNSGQKKHIYNSNTNPTNKIKQQQHK